MASIDPTMVCYHQLNATAIAAMGMYKLRDVSWAMIAPSMEPRMKWSSLKRMWSYSLVYQHHVKSGHVGGARVRYIRRWILVTSAETTRSRSIQSSAVVAEVWAFIHRTTWLAIGIPGHTYFSHAIAANTAWTTGMAPLK